MLLGSVVFLKATFSSIPEKPHNANSLWIEPSIINKKHGEKFNITMWINITNDGFTWQSRLVFNSTYLNATRVGYTAGATSDFFSGQATIPVTPTINNIRGCVEYGESLLGMTSATGVGSLFWIEFKVVNFSKFVNIFLISKIFRIQ